MAKYNVSKSEAERLGIERVRIGGDSSSSSSSSNDSDNKPLNDSDGNPTGKTISPDVAEKIKDLGADAQDYILDQDFGGNLNMNEFDRFENKWIEADAINKQQTSSLLSGMLPEHMQNKTIGTLSPEAFQTLIPSLMPGTPEYQEAMDKLSTAYFDVMQQQMDAKTDQEKSAADYNWKTLKKTIESNLNINLSEDAFAAWDQIQTVTGQKGEQGLTGSGMENQSIDAALNEVRRRDATARKESMSKEDQSNMDYFTNFATPDQVKDLIATNPDKAKEYGLVPSDEIRNSMTATALKAKNPSMTDDDINRAIASVMDENGNYRSKLYQKHMVGSKVGANAATVGDIVYDQYGNPTNIGVNPSDSGKLDIDRARELYQDQNTPLATQLANFNKLKELGAINPTSHEAGGTSGTVAGNQFDETGVTDPNAQALQDAAENMSDSMAEGSDDSSDNDSGSSSSSGNNRGGLSVREYEAQQKGGKLNYDTGEIRLPDGSLL